MRRFWPLFVFVMIFVVAFVTVKSKHTSPSVEQSSPQRIISLAPNITEILFALDLANNVVAVSDYCDFPSEVVTLPKVGGFVNPNLEAIVAQQADLVILSAKQQRTIEQLQQLNIPTLAIRSATLLDIKNAIHAIGERTSRHRQAKSLLDSLNSKINRIATKTKRLEKPKVMISMGNSSGESQINTVYIAGNKDFYNDLITLAGGVNAYQDPRFDVPSVSVEGIIQLNPDIIIDIYPDENDHSADLDLIRQRWQSLEHINAIKNKQLHIIEQGYATIPGPRVMLLLEQFARLIHPEIQWDTP